MAAMAKVPPIRSAETAQFHQHNKLRRNSCKGQNNKICARVGVLTEMKFLAMNIYIEHKCQMCFHAKCDIMGRLWFRTQGSTTLPTNIQQS